MSLDLSKAFDRIELEPLFQALSDQGICENYLRILASIYTGQTGQLRGSRQFPIQRGVKQGDVLSPLLFSASLEAAVGRWKLETASLGIRIDDGDLLTNKYPLCRRLLDFRYVWRTIMSHDGNIAKRIGTSRA